MFFFFYGGGVGGDCVYVGGVQVGGTWWLLDTIQLRL